MGTSNVQMISIGLSLSLLVRAKFESTIRGRLHAWCFRRPAGRIFDSGAGLVTDENLSVARRSIDGGRGGLCALFSLCWSEQANNASRSLGQAFWHASGAKCANIDQSGGQSCHAEMDAAHYQRAEVLARVGSSELQVCTLLCQARSVEQGKVCTWPGPLGA